MVGNITPIPNLPSHVDGGNFSRGKVIPNVSNRKKITRQLADVMQDQAKEDYKKQIKTLRVLSEV